MSYDLDGFDDEQKQLLSKIVDDLDGPTATLEILNTLESSLYQLDPDWEIGQSLAPDLRKRVDVCLAALHYAKVQSLAKVS
ncbi:hypothetical protein G5V57_17715 [Nordella sp. HKS 07]|uniref:hypothetical protein n=1 Tax=Nordella sp. HKS 07 TaxID=2712222 RepID=UPI0013E18281|nr:hypothetical protein [Nordella sp. HKS 07]QIG49393.1 hypothetical protein G5V57_17715 [Nordella sp. HKS 07]